MVGKKTVKFMAVSSQVYALSGLATLCTVNSAGRLRQFKLSKGLNSGVVTVFIYNGSNVAYAGDTPLGSGIGIQYADVTASMLLNSGSALISGVVTTTVAQPIEFDERLVVQYGVSSGNIDVSAVVEVDRFQS